MHFNTVVSYYQMIHLSTMGHLTYIDTFITSGFLLLHDTFAPTGFLKYDDTHLIH